MRAKFIDSDFENHEYMTNLNYNGPVAHVKSILPHLIANKSG
jgi:NADP-dependent 3-hydroxy acid dehydrogenase YdfG